MIRSLSPLALILLVACGGSGIGGNGNGNGEDTDTTTPPEPDRVQSESWSDESNGQGIVKVKVEVDEATTAFMVTGESKKYVSLERLLDPDGNVVLHWQDWWSSPESLTYAFFGFDKTTALNWPVREEDGPLTPGTWTVELSTLDATGGYAGNSKIDISVHQKQDDDLSDGTVRVHVLWADGVGAEAEVVSAVEGAVDRWAEVWGNYGLSLEASYLDTTLDPRLGFTYGGSEELEAVVEDFAPGDLVVVVGEQVLNEADTFGVSGGIPGTLAPSPMTFVVISWLAHAGGDGKFKNDEIRLMGETMAHEVGHYTGLFHPVEWNYNAWDALGDTPACNSWQSCEGELGANLMFPYPICTFSGCAPQDQLTGDQQAVAQRYTGTL